MKIKMATRAVATAAFLSAAWLSLPLSAQPKPPEPTAAEIARKQEMQALGAKHDTAIKLYEALKGEAARSGAPARTADWSGVWTRGKGGLQFDPDLSRDAPPSTARLTAQGQRRLDAKVKQIKETGGEYDPISDCRPPGVPRWFTEPFLKEFVVTKDQTWLMNEMVNDVRRIYTDGRAHTPEADAYPLWNGDSIGFWTGDALIAHTNQLMSGQYQRGTQPDYSEKVEVVERWRKVDDRNIHVDLWVYDPVNLAQPWYTRQIYTRLGNDDKSLRIRYWDCRENENNQIVVRDDGTSQFKSFGFVKDNAAASNDPHINNPAPPKK